MKIAITGVRDGLLVLGLALLLCFLGVGSFFLADLGMTRLTIRNTGGADHLSFDAVGLPGFQFIQDPLDYDTRRHHSKMDVYERIQEPDMKQMAVIVASIVYLTANRDGMVPRKPLAKTRPKRTSPF